MIKILSALFLMTASLFSQDFEQFLDNAIKNSPYLKASNLSIQQIAQTAQVLTRYENPTLELEFSNFRPDFTNDMNGHRIAYSQPIRLWGVGDAKDELSLAMQNTASSTYQLDLANFKKNIALAYTHYSNKKQLLLLGDEELTIAKKIYDISQERNRAGTISKSELLQSLVEYEMIKVKVQNLKFTTQESYYALLKTAGYSHEIELDFSYKFKLHEGNLKIHNPDLSLIQSEQQQSLASTQVNSNAIEWISLIAQYEAEPGQNIFRIAAEIPLAFFNTKKEEMRISQLSSNKAELMLQNKKARLSIETIQRTRQRELLLELRTLNEDTLKNQMKLLKMFEEGYKIASINLLQHQSIKNNMIQTKENIIKINTALNQNAILTNYIKGIYND